jgi:hypothetical protein
MSGHLRYNFPVKAEYLLGHVHIPTSYFMNTITCIVKFWI